MMIKALVCAFTIALLAGCGGVIVPITTGDQLGFSETASPVAPPPTTAEDANFGRILNTLRINNGLGTVAYDARLDAAAQAHAEDMVANTYFSHVSLDGRMVLDRIKEAGYQPIAYGENIAGRQQSDQEVLTAWINSPSHNEVLNVPRFEDFALGVAGQGSMTRWVLLMAVD